MMVVLGNTQSVNTSRPLVTAALRMSEINQSYVQPLVIPQKQLEMSANVEQNIYRFPHPRVLRSHEQNYIHKATMEVHS